MSVKAAFGCCEFCEWPAECRRLSACQKPDKGRATAHQPINIRPVLPTDAAARKNAPIARGVLDYFPAAIAAVAECSRLGNEQHNPGQPMHWAREKSTDHADCIVRHLMERGTVDTDGVRHATKVAWRALALLQTELEETTDRRPVPPRG